MNNENQKDINLNQQKFLNQLELLAEQAATPVFLTQNEIANWRSLTESMFEPGVNSVT